MHLQKKRQLNSANNAIRKVCQRMQELLRKELMLLKQPEKKLKSDWDTVSYPVKKPLTTSNRPKSFHSRMTRIKISFSFFETNMRKIFLLLVCLGICSTARGQFYSYSQLDSLVINWATSIQADYPSRGIKMKSIDYPNYCYRIVVHFSVTTYMGVGKLSAAGQSERLRLP